MDRPRQYEDNLLTSVADSDLPDPSQPSRVPSLETQADEPLVLTQPTLHIAATVSSFLALRSDAADVLSAVADNLGITLANPGPAPFPDATDAPSARHGRPGFDPLADAFSAWHAEVAGRRRLASLIATIRSRRMQSSRMPSPAVAPSASTPELIRVVKWEERDAALRSSAASLSGSSSTSSFPPSVSACPSPPPTDKLVVAPQLPFAADSLPDDLLTHKDKTTIIKVLSSRPDLKLTSWFHRALFTAENYVQWAAWSQPSRDHRDRLDAGRVFSDRRIILIAPDLRSASSNKSADAWHSYRRHLLIHLRQALTLGFSWSDILARLSSTLDDPDEGYPRISNYVTAAIDDTVLVRYPLLHADVLIYKLDCSYSVGSYKYSADSVSVNWESATARRPGEGPIDLAVRVTNAFVIMHDSESITSVTVWSTPSYVTKINKRYAECLSNDLAYPERGAASVRIFLLQWERHRAAIAANPTISVLTLSCEYLAEIAVVPYESATFVYDEDEEDAPDGAPPLRVHPGAPPLPAITHRQGQGARARAAARARAPYDE